MSKRSVRQVRLFDPARGSFDPVLREPAVTRENPQGVRRPGKTAQDRLPVSQRPRVKAWQARQGR